MTDWWSSLIPPHAPHRVLVLTALDYFSSFLGSMAEMAAFVLSQFEHPPVLEPCVELFVLFAGAAAKYEALGRWASTLQEEPGTLLFGRREAGAVGHGPVGVVQRWVSHAGRLFYSEPWDHRTSCQDVAWNILDWQVLWLMIEAVLRGVGDMQGTFPWLVDSALVASRAGLPALVPEHAEALSSDAAVLAALLRGRRRGEAPRGSPRGQAAPLAVEVGVDEAATSVWLLEEIPSLRLVGVDPYLDAYGGVPSAERKDGMGGSSRHLAAAARLAAFGGRARLLRQRSLEAAAEWAEGEIDLVFIDGEHDFDSCRQEELLEKERAFAEKNGEADNASRAKAAEDFWNECLAPRWEGPEGVPQITASEVLQRQKEVPGSVLLLDCRPQSERDVSVLPGALSTEEFEKDPKGLSQDKVVVVYCTLGGRSAPVVGKYLKEQPDTDFKNLKLSIVDWCHAGGELADPAGQPTNKVAFAGPTTSPVPGMFPVGVEVVRVS